MTNKRPPRLTRTDWLAAGYTALAIQGPDALRAEALAREMGTTKGSFYWHFADVPAFHKDMLDGWEVTVAGRISEISEGPGAATARLRELAQFCTDTEESVLSYGQPAIRAWGLRYDYAAQALARVDALCHEHMSRLMREIGVTNPELARIICATSIGMAALGGRTATFDAKAMGSLVDLILALR